MSSLLPAFCVLLLILTGPMLQAQKINQTISGEEAAATFTEPIPLPDAQPFELHETHPSRHTGVMKIEFNVTVPGHYVISAVGARGRNIETISEQYFDAGDHVVPWMVNPGAHGIYMHYAHHDGMPYFHRLLIIKY